MTKAMFRLFQVMAVLLTASPAFANADLPPVKYDPGAKGQTEAQIVKAYRNKIELHRVAIGTAGQMCDRLSMKRYGVHYADDENGTSLGCQLEDENGSHKVVVYSYDTPERAKMKGRKFFDDLALRMIRHEVGHALGWSGDHSGGRP